MLTSSKVWNTIIAFARLLNVFSLLVCHFDLLLPSSPPVRYLSSNNHLGFFCSLFALLCRLRGCAYSQFHCFQHLCRETEIRKYELVPKPQSLSGTKRASLALLIQILNATYIAKFKCLPWVSLKNELMITKFKYEYQPNSDIFWSTCEAGLVSKSLKAELS